MSTTATTSAFDFFIQGIAKAQVMNSSRYFEPGTYLVKIDTCTFFHNRKHQPRVGVNCTVVDSNNVDFPETSQVSWIVPLDSDSGKEVIKTFICDVSGRDPSSITNEAVTDVFILPGVVKMSAFAGRLAIVNVFEKRTEKGGVFTKCDWRGFNPQDTRPDFRNMPKLGGKSLSADAEDAAAENVNVGWGGAPNAQSKQNGGWAGPSQVIANASGSSNSDNIPF